MNRSIEITEMATFPIISPTVSPGDGSLSPVESGVGDFNDGMRRLTEEYAAEATDFDSRFNRPSAAGVWLSKVNDQLVTAFNSPFPENFSSVSVLEQIQMAGEMHRRIMSSGVVLSLTQATLKGAEKACEAILNQKG